MKYLITYDLRKPGQNYSALINQIKEISDGYSKPCESVWVINSNLSVEEIVNKLNAADATDRVLVVSVAKPWWSSGLDVQVVDWLKMNL